MTTNNASALVATSNTLSTNLPETLATELAGLHALDHLDQEDRPLPAYTFNTKLQMPDGSWLPKDTFFNTLTGEVKDEINCVLLHIKKSRRWATYSESTGMTEHCSSQDGREGVTPIGEINDCVNCKHRLWGKSSGRGGGNSNGNGSTNSSNTVPDCDIVYTMLGIDLDDDNPFIIRARATSRKPVQRYLARNFLGKLKLPDSSRADLPLFVCRTKLSLTTPTGTYAVLQLDRDSDCAEAEIRAYKSIYETLKGIIQPSSDDDNGEQA